MAAKPSSALRRYYLRFAVSMALYALLLVGAVLLVGRTPAGPLRYLLALAPAAPILGMIASLGRYLVEEADEFRRMLLAQSMLWGIGLSLSVATVWGFLETLAGAPRLPLYLMFPIFCAGMGLSQPFLFRRYR